jgi:DNA-binding MarR family transcriptional regulator
MQGLFMENYLNQPTYKAALIQSQAYRALNNFMIKFLTDYDLSLSEWKLLGHLTETDRITPAEISALLSIRPPITSRLLGILEEKKLLKRSDSQKDSRTKFVNITPRGQKLVQKIEKALRPMMKRYLSDVDLKDLDAYVKILSQIATKL